MDEKKEIHVPVYNYFIFALFLVFAVLYYIDLFNDGFNDPDSGEMTVMVLGGFVYVIIGFVIFFSSCTGKVVYDKTHIEYIAFDGKTEISIQYKDLDEIYYMCVRAGKGRSYKYVFKEISGVEHSIKNFGKPEVFRDMYYLARIQNPYLKFYKDEDYFLRREKVEAFGDIPEEFAKEYCDEHKNSISSEPENMDLSMFNLSSKGVEEFNRRCESFLSGVVKVHYVDASLSSFTKRIYGVDVAQSYIDVQLDSMDNFELLGLGKTGNGLLNWNDEFAFTEEIRKVFVSLTGRRPGFVFFTCSENNQPEVC